jgi:hypothetical protein
MPTSKTCTLAGEVCLTIGGVADRRGQHVETTKRHRKQGKLPPSDFKLNGREYWRESTLNRHEQALMQPDPAPKSGRQRVRRKTQADATA